MIVSEKKHKSRGHSRRRDFRGRRNVSSGTSRFRSASQRKEKEVQIWRPKVNDSKFESNFNEGKDEAGPSGVVTSDHDPTQNALLNDNTVLVNRVLSKPNELAVTFVEKPFSPPHSSLNSETVCLDKGEPTPKEFQSPMPSSSDQAMPSEILISSAQSLGQSVDAGPVGETLSGQNLGNGNGEVDNGSTEMVEIQ
ncbi:hypothetical protein COLO4_34156 [Corchorus olitorius]|uniref:Uncharacterized protein n=1 Tax=Corchorus olitorius TaxID=93759 RepID=A0A1R3GNE4_9ROSI|nr:hypothetical protein COLO4_34156 [Corchorus olitorius]